MQADPLTSTAATGALRALGVREGDRLLVHASVRSLGPLADRAETLVAALLATVGQSGLLVAPTFTYWRHSAFSPQDTPGRTGAVGELLRTRAGAVRSWHPTHSVSAFGAGARDLVADHHLAGSVGAGSPFDLLAREGGRILLLGVGHTTNTTIHAGEALAPARYLSIPFAEGLPGSIPVETPAGPIDVPLDTLAGCSKAFGALECDLRERGAIRDGLVGPAPAQLMDARDVVAATIARLGGDPHALLCTDPACYRCSRARAAG